MVYDGAAGVAAIGASMQSRPVLGKKLDFVFGKAGGRRQNIQRSTTMQRQLNTIGIYDNSLGRSYLTKKLIDAFDDKTNVISNNNGFVTKETLLMGPEGGLLMKSVWKKNDLIAVKLLGK